MALIHNQPSFRRLALNQRIRRHGRAVHDDVDFGNEIAVTETQFFGRNDEDVDEAFLEFAGGGGRFEYRDRASLIGNKTIRERPADIDAYVISHVHPPQNRLSNSISNTLFGFEFDLLVGAFESGCAKFPFDRGDRLPLWQGVSDVSAAKSRRRGSMRLQADQQREREKRGGDVRLSRPQSATAQATVSL